MGAFESPAYGGHRQPISICRLSKAELQKREDSRGKLLNRSKGDDNGKEQEKCAI
jgi:hypothetical protein